MKFVNIYIKQEQAHFDELAPLIFIKTRKIYLIIVTLFVLSWFYQYQFFVLLLCIICEIHSVNTQRIQV